MFSQFSHSQFTPSLFTNSTSAMGGGASKRKKEEAAEKAAKALLKKEKDQKKASAEEQFHAYQESLRKKDERSQLKTKEHTKDQSITNEDHDIVSEEEGHYSHDSLPDNVSAHQHQRPLFEEDERVASVPEVEPLPPVQIVNPHVFDEFSNEFKARFVEEHQLGRPADMPRESRYKKVDKVKIYEKNIDRNNDTTKGKQSQKTSSTFDVASYHWLRDLNATFSPPNEEEEEEGTHDHNTQTETETKIETKTKTETKTETETKIQTKTETKTETKIQTKGQGNHHNMHSNFSLGRKKSHDKCGGFLVDAKNRSIANIKEINKTHLDATCLALDVSSNRFTEIHFKNTLSNLLFLNVAGNLLVSLEGIHCCKHLIVSNDGHFCLIVLLACAVLLVQISISFQLVSNCFS